MDNLSGELERFIERLPFGIMVLNADLRIELRNELSLTLLDAGLENILNTDFLDIVRDHAAVKDCVLTVVSGNIQQQHTMLSIGERVLGCTALRAGEMMPGGLIVLIEDATNIKKIEQLKREFIGTLLHKLRSPLATLKTSFSMLNYEIANPDPKKHGEIIEIIGMCSEEVDRLSALIADMRDLFLIETNLAEKDLELEDFPVDKAISAAIEALKNTFSTGIVGKRVVFSGNADLRIFADFEKTKKIFFILIKNGLHYSPAEAPVEISVSGAADSIDVAIKDRGIGIRDSMRNQVFGKYFREDNDITRGLAGNGLGLYIAKAYVELMKGSIYFESKQGEGTRFHLSFPRTGAVDHG
jgi:two-component system, OmpR family, phosphate regulon sensor histidine kinase PhoR